MYGDQWRSELVRLLGREQRRLLQETSGRRPNATVERLVSHGQGNSAPGASSTAAPIAAILPRRVFTSASAGARAAKLGARLIAPSAEAAFGLGAIVSGLTRLLGAATHPAPAPLAVFRMPTPIAYEGSLAGPGTTAGGVRYTSSGLPSPVTNTAPADPFQGRNLMDYSGAIASAVQRAMLESHSLNSVVMDL